MRFKDFFLLSENPDINYYPVTKFSGDSLTEKHIEISSPIDGIKIYVYKSNNNFNYVFTTTENIEVAQVTISKTNFGYQVTNMIKDKNTHRDLMYIIFVEFMLPKFKKISSTDYHSIHAKNSG